ncbi:MAG TPA: ATPase, T2SS/T4P/T4SS family [Candidatus Absconditabacterales bacterium]|nr:ATPase, T2SS/T4P/T4SS family [Candidatus Absconditabacterales bacterium]
MLKPYEPDLTISDILIRQGEVLVYRKNGILEYTTTMIDQPLFDALLMDLTTNHALQTVNVVEQDGIYQSPGGYFYRINAFLSGGKPSLALRKITNHAPELTSLMAPILVNTLIKLVLSRSSGLFLVTGTAGSGKSTTLMSCLEYINQHYPKHIVTIEDPIEYVYRHKHSFFSQRQVGDDTHTFESGLKSLLRQNPDIVLVGEIRDKQSADAVISIAETGHLVLSTLHTKSALSTISRLISFFPPEQQPSIQDRLADIFVGSLAQTLVPLPHTVQPNEHNKDILSNQFQRIGLFELMLGNTAVTNSIRKGDFKQLPSCIQTGRSQGMMSMEDYKILIGL